MESHEQCHLEECKVDVPTISAIYPNPDGFGDLGIEG